jgi:hypothetical protein
MRRSDEPTVPPHRFSIDHATNNAPPPPRRPSNAQQGPSYLWNGTYQQLILVSPEHHPNYRQNREMIMERSENGIEGQQDERSANCGRQPSPVNRQPAR